MSYMGWIAQMITDDTYLHFKELYVKASKNNNRSFIFEHSKCDTILAKHICKYVDTHLMNDYEEHLLRQAKLNNEYEHLITKGF